MKNIFDNTERESKLRRYFFTLKTMPTNNTPQPHQPAQPEFRFNTFPELLEGGRNIVHQAIDKTRTAF